MTSSPIGTDQELIERLRKMELREVSRDGYCREQLAPINPDGPEAADALVSRISEVERLNAECERAWESQKIAYEQAMANGEALSEARAEVERLRELLGRVEPHLDAIVCYASTMGEHEPNQIAFDVRATLSQHRTTDLAHPNNEG